MLCSPNKIILHVGSDLNQASLVPKHKGGKLKQNSTPVVFSISDSAWDNTVFM